MPLTRLAGENFRLFDGFELNPQPGLNLIVGPNAAGKTTLLEAVYALARGRSFRADNDEIAGRQGPHWRVAGRLDGEPAMSLTVAWSPEGIAARSDTGPLAMQDVVSQLPIEVLEPDSHRLLEDGPAYRRRFLDWGVFHVEHDFYPAWRRYRAALRQRNAALKAGAPDHEVAAWEPELAAAGETVHGCRERHLALLREALSPQLAALLGVEDFSLDLARGWPAGTDLASALRKHAAADRPAATTRVGPHRAELRLRLSGRSARHHVSRGQEKMLVAALLLAQAALVGRATGRLPILLVDDFPAELGAPFQEALLIALGTYGGQVLLTAIEPGTVLEKRPEIPLFHVEHGTVRGPLQV